MRRIALICFAAVLISDAASAMQFASGCYTGDGGGSKAITTGYCAEDNTTFCAVDGDCSTTCTTFQPKVVIWTETSTGTSGLVGWFATDAMSMPRSCEIYRPLSANTTCGTTIVQSLDAAGFTIGTAGNTNLSTYCWVAFTGTSTEIATGTIDAAGTTTIGFQAEMISAHETVTNQVEGLSWYGEPWQPTAIPTSPTPTPNVKNEHYAPDKIGFSAATGILSITATGFTTGTGYLNSEYFFAIAGGYVDVGTYVGDATASDTTQRNIPLGARPLFVWLQKETLTATSVDEERCSTMMSEPITTTNGSPFHLTFNDVEDASSAYAFGASAQFTVANSATSTEPDCNTSGQVYHYWAILAADADAPTATPTATPTDTPTATPTDTATNTPTDTATATPTDTPTNTPTDTPTNTPTATPTDTPTNTPTDTPTNTPTDTPTNTPTATPTATPTFTPTLGVPEFRAFVRKPSRGTVPTPIHGRRHKPERFIVP